MDSSDGIRVGIGGWTFAPWRSNFYPAGLVQRRELEYASRHVTAIEINGTYYGTQKPATYAKWRDEAPDGFMFSAKAPKRIMASRVLAKAGAQIDDFIGGIVELGDKLGPLVWQFEQGRKLEADDFAAFLALLPKDARGRSLRHVLDVRDPAFIDADFVYARLMRTQSGIETGYADQELKRWAERARLWAAGGKPDDLPRIGPPVPTTAQRRDVFIYFISAAKERNPAAAMALLRRLGLAPREAFRP